jgi:hypothetical protein
MDYWLGLGNGGRSRTIEIASHRRSQLSHPSVTPFVLIFLPSYNFDSRMTNHNSWLYEIKCRDY